MTLPTYPGGLGHFPVRPATEELSEHLVKIGQYAAPELTRAPLAIIDGKPYYPGDTLPDIPEPGLAATRRDALDAHVEEYLADRVTIVIDGVRQGPSSLALRDAVEHGWHGATAELAEELEALVTEAREQVAKRMPYPILAKLDAIVEDLKTLVDPTHPERGTK